MLADSKAGAVAVHAMDLDHFKAADEPVRPSRAATRFSSRSRQG